MNPELLMSNSNTLASLLEISQSFMDDHTEIDNFLKKYAVLPPNDSKEDKVIRILKGGFEKEFGMSFEEFVEIRNRLVESNPEKLI